MGQPSGKGNEDRRRVILDTAARLLRHYGPAKTTMADIARAADIAVGSVYLEFASKEVGVVHVHPRRRHAHGHHRDVDRDARRGRVDGVPRG